MRDPALQDELDAVDELFLAFDERTGANRLHELAKERVRLAEELYGRRHPASLERRYDLSELLHISADFVGAYSELLKIKRFAEGVLISSSPLLLLVNARIASMYQQQGQTLESAVLFNDVFVALRSLVARLDLTSVQTLLGPKLRALLGIVLHSGDVSCMYRFLKLSVTNNLLPFSDTLSLIESNAHTLSSQELKPLFDEILTGVLRQLAENSAALERAEILSYLIRLKGIGVSGSADFQVLIAKAILELFAGEELSNIKVVVEQHIDLASLFLNKGELEQAHSHYELAMHFFNQKAGQEHRSSSTSSTLGEIAFVFGRLEESREHLKDALERSLDNSDGAAETARIVHNLGTLALVGNQLDEAAQYLQNALELKRRNFGVEHEETQLTLIALGMLESSRGDEKCARGYFHEALHIESELFGEDTEQFLRIQGEIEKLSSTASLKSPDETKILTLSDSSTTPDQKGAPQMPLPVVEIDSPGFFKTGRGSGRA